MSAHIIRISDRRSRIPHISADDFETLPRGFGGNRPLRPLIPPVTCSAVTCSAVTSTTRCSSVKLYASEFSTLRPVLQRLTTSRS